jgi:hypothetical protein
MSQFVEEVMLAIPSSKLGFGFQSSEGFAIKITQDAVDLVFVFPPETGVNLGCGDLAHELDAPFAEVGTEIIIRRVEVRSGIGSRVVKLTK